MLPPVTKADVTLDGFKEVFDPTTQVGSEGLLHAPYVVQHYAQPRGDARTYHPSLYSSPGVKFDATGYYLLFSIKTAISDSDADAKVQKASGAGLAWDGQECSLDLIHQDTKDLTPGMYYWDIQAQSLTEPGIVKTVAVGTIELTTDVTQELEPTLPIYTHTPPPRQTNLSSFADVAITEPAENDVLMFSADRWRNQPQHTITDGGNF